MSPGLRSSARMTRTEKLGRKKKAEERRWGFGSGFLRLILVLSLIFVAEYVFSSAVSGVLKPAFSADTARKIGQKSWVAKDLNGKLRFLEKSLQGLVDGKVSNCSYANSKWEINQVLDLLFLL